MMFLIPSLLIRLPLVLGTIAFAANTVAGESAKRESKGFEIAAKSDRSDRGFGVSQVDVMMHLEDSSGRTSKRSLMMQTQEVSDEDVGDKSLIVFNSPADVKDTKLLSHAQILEPDDQWLYLPALKRVKRISSANKSGPFVGSEFAFEDFTAQELNKYTYTFVEETTCAELICAVIDRTPKYANSGYTRQRAKIDLTHYQVREISFYDRKQSHLKTLTLSDYKLHTGKYWRPQVMLMQNHQTGKKTTLAFSNYDFSVRLSHRDFSKSSLK